MTLDDSSFVFTRDRTFNRRLIGSLDEYLSYVSFLSSSWDFYPWFRGVSSSNFRLVPSIYRPRSWNYSPVYARALADEFIREGRGVSREEIGRRSRWDWYQIMQHHGLPTRLLDWTEGSMIGLYFALRQGKADSYPCVWVLDPLGLNEQTTGREAIYYTESVIQSEGDEITESYLEDSPELPQLPIAICPAYVTPRIKAQQGCFTIHGRMKSGLHSAYRRSPQVFLVQLRLSSRSAGHIKEDLLTAGISESALFPDLEGLARELRWEFGFSDEPKRGTKKLK